MTGCKCFKRTDYICWKSKNLKYILGSSLPTAAEKKNVETSKGCQTPQAAESREWIKGAEEAEEDSDREDLHGWCRYWWHSYSGRSTPKQTLPIDSIWPGVLRGPDILHKPRGRVRKLSGLWGRAGKKVIIQLKHQPTCPFEKNMTSPYRDDILSPGSTPPTM